MCAMSDFELQLWSPCDSDMAGDSDSFQFWSTNPVPDMSVSEPEMTHGLGTRLWENMPDDDEFTKALEALLQPAEILPPILEDNHGACAAIVNVINPESALVPSSVSRIRCRWPNFVWLICACNRFSHAAAAAAASLRAKVPQSPGTALKGVMRKKDKYVCEMRVMMKMQKEKNKLIRKVWLGTYKTQAQAARALDVGKFFFNRKEIKNFSNPDSGAILSNLSFLLAQPLEKLVQNVKKLAKHYGENGSLQNFVLACE